MEQITHAEQKDNYANKNIHPQNPENKSFKKLKNSGSGLRKLPTIPSVSISKYSTMNADTKQWLNNGRISVDSAYFENQSIDDGDERSISRTSGRRTPGAGRISPASGKKWFAVIDAIREKRQKAAKENHQKMKEMESLKVNLEQVQAKARTLEAEVEPLKEKLRRYEGIIEDLEDKVGLQDQESVTRDKSYTSQILQLQQQTREMLEKEDLRKLEYQNNMQDECRRLTIENGDLKKQIDEWNDSMAHDSSSTKSDDDPKLKQLSNMRAELMNVRQILESSEQERLNERKEKLSTIQTMIRLTKQKSDLEEELYEIKKEDKNEISMKYTRLFQKYEENSYRLKQLHGEGVKERTELRKKYLGEIQHLTLQHEKDLQDIKSDRKTLQKSLEDITARRERDAENILKDINSVKEVPEIIDSLSSEGIYHPGTSGKDLLQKLFRQYKLVHEKLELSNILESDVPPITESLKGTNRKLKRQLEDANDALHKKESELQVLQAALQRQIDDLLTEKKNAYMQTHKTTEDLESSRDEIEDLKKELHRSKESFVKKTAELSMLRENLMSVTTEMKTVDAELGKTKRDLAVKDAEIMRLKQDLLHEQEKSSTENSSSIKTSEELEKKRKMLRESEKAAEASRHKLVQLEEILEATKPQLDRVSNERGQLQQQILEIKGDTVEKERKVAQLENVIETLKSQNTMLEASVKEKIEQFSSTSLEVDHLRTELLATQHILSEEEYKSADQVHDIEQLSSEIKKQSQALMALEQQNRQLENELRHVKNKFENMEFDYKDTESSLQEHSSSKSILRKELQSLQTQCKELTREKQKLQEIIEKTNIELEEEKIFSKQVKDQCRESKEEMSTKNMKLNRLSSENETLLQDYDFLQGEYSGLEAGIGSNKSTAIQIFNECQQLKNQMTMLKEKNTELSEDLKTMKNVLEENKRKNKAEIKSLNYQNMKLKNLITKASLSTDDIDEPLLEAAVANDVESALPLDDFVILDDVEPYNECTTESVNKTRKVPIEEDLAEEINWLMTQSAPAQQDEPLFELEVEKNKLWNETLVKDNQIQVMSSQLQAKEAEKKCLEEQIQTLEEKILQSPPKHKDEQLKQMQEELQASLEEKNEAVQCLKALLTDNEALTTCLRDQQQSLNFQRKENEELMKKLNESLDQCQAQEDMFSRTKNKLREVMESSVLRESNASIEQKKEIEQLKNEVQLSREENRQLQIHLDEKTHEATQVQEDLNSIRGAIEYNLGSMDAEKRSKDFVEDQLKLVLHDRGHTLQKLQSSELLNKMLEAKLIDLQKWHNSLEINLLKSRDFDPVPLDMIKMNQSTHDDFLQEQTNIVNNKLYELDDSRDHKNILNSFENFIEES